MIKILTLKVFHPGNKKFERKVIRAGKGKRFLDEGVERWLLSVARQIEKSFPDQEYNLVPIGPAAFNFVHAGPMQPPVLESTPPA